MGVEFLGMNAGEAQIGLTLNEHHMNSWQVAHGGVSLTLLDVAMAMATRSLDARVRAGVTVEMKTSFLQSAGKPGERLLAKGKVWHRSTTLCFCEAELWNGERLVAKAMGTFKMLKRLDAAPRIK
ncbi:MAG: PaaI family thioesterase [Proteobacteria bacterium]|nr:PaaI family thioesterase [Pseudomonadota bacterium]